MQVERWLQRASLMVALAVASTTAWPQLVDLDPDWREIEVPPPPAFDRDTLLAVEMPPHLTLKFGVDAATIKLAQDGVVRYVVVASSPSGAMNAMYEGIRCASGEFKTYARFSPSGKWNQTVDPQWRSMWDTQVSRHTRALAFQGVCDGRAVGGHSARDIVQRLKGSRKVDAP
jgi:CNP1-like family